LTGIREWVKIGVERPDQPDWRCFVSEQSTVPDFFQEETPDALRLQVDWLTSEVGLDASFFSKLLKMNKQAFTNWQRSSADLTPGKEDTLRRFWQTMLHILSFLNFESSRVQELFQHATPARSRDERLAQTPPWSGMTLKAYFEQGGDPAVEKVDCWVTGLRFGDLCTA
jgi:hypothetical protein